MSKDDGAYVHVIDAVGASLVAACVAGFIWLAVMRSGATSERIDELTRFVKKAEQDLATFRGVCRRQRTLLAERKAELSRTGHLPARTPIEPYFQTLSDLAERHGLKVNRQHPMSPRQYPGLLEQRYAYELTGSTKGIIGFFRGVEQTEFWADIAYLKIERGSGPVGFAADNRNATLTFSLFSALPADTPAEDG